MDVIDLTEECAAAPQEDVDLAEQVENIRQQLRGPQSKQRLDALKRRYRGVMNDIATQKYILPELEKDIQEDKNKLVSARLHLQHAKDIIRSENADGLNAVKNELQTTFYHIISALSGLVPLRRFRKQFEQELARTDIMFPGIILAVDAMLAKVNTIADEKRLKHARVLCKMNVLKNVSPIPDEAFLTREERRDKRGEEVAKMRRKNKKMKDEEALAKSSTKKLADKRRNAARERRAKAAQDRRLKEVVKRLLENVVTQCVNEGSKQHVVNRLYERI